MKTIQIEDKLLIFSIVQSFTHFKELTLIKFIKTSVSFESLDFFRDH
jgi:hypothetical protein